MKTALFALTVITLLLLLNLILFIFLDRINQNLEEITILLDNYTIILEP